MNTVWKTIDVKIAFLFACAGLLLWAIASFAQTPQPKHHNSAVEMWAQGQPAYYMIATRSGPGTAYEDGKKDSKTWADFIVYDMEVPAYDIVSLTQYMEGLGAGGPTRTGHKTPAVVVNLPMRGTDEATVRANQWMVEQVLGTGIHGIFLVHATTAGAVRALVEEIRYPNREQGVGLGLLAEGARGAHGATSAAKIWGVSDEEYERTADVWPLNPNGDIIVGLKIEDKHGVANLNDLVKVPGIAFGEGGLSDLSLSFGLKRDDPRGLEIEGKIFAAAQIQHLNWSMNIGATDTPDLENNVRAAIRQGRMVESREAIARIGRKITTRPHPWPGE